MVDFYRDAYLVLSGILLSMSNPHGVVIHLINPFGIFTLMMLGLPWTGMTIPQKDRPYPQVSDCLLETLQSRSLQGPVTGPGVGVETDFKGELSFLQYRIFSVLPFRGLLYWQTQWLP